MSLISYQRCFLRVQVTRRTPRRCPGVFSCSLLPCFQSVSVSGPVPLCVQLGNCRVLLSVRRRHFITLSHLISAGGWRGDPELRECCFGRKYRLMFLMALTKREVYRRVESVHGGFHSIFPFLPRMIRCIKVASCISVKGYVRCMVFISSLPV